MDQRSVRMRYLPIPTRMGPCSRLSYSEPIRRQYQSLQAIRSIIPSTCRWAIYTMTCDVPMEMRSCRSHSWPFPKVRCVSSKCLIVYSQFWGTGGRLSVKATDEFRTFTKQLYHASLAQILSPLCPAMTTPHPMMCPDGYYRRAIFQLGPFIADYPEQVCLTGIVSGWCPKSVKSFNTCLDCVTECHPDVMLSQTSLIAQADHVSKLSQTVSLTRSPPVPYGMCLA